MKMVYRRDGDGGYLVYRRGILIGRVERAPERYGCPKEWQATDLRGVLVVRFAPTRSAAAEALAGRAK